MTLDYRFPDTREHRVLQVMAELQSEEVIDWMLAVPKLLAGVPLALVPPFVITFLFHPLGLKEGFGRAFVGVSLIVVPALMYLERRERQDYLWEASQEWFAMWMLDLLLFGPRLLWSLYDQIHRPPPGEEAVALAAKIVVEMLDADQTIDVRQLLGPDRTAREVTQALRLLEHRGWVCVARNRSRAWLGTSVRKQFAGLR